MVPRVQNFLKGWIIRRMQRNPSEQASDYSPERMFSRVGFLASRSDDPTLSGWTIGLMCRSNDQRHCIWIGNQSTAPDDPMLRCKKVGQKRRSNDVVFAGAEEEKVFRTGRSDTRRSNASDYLTVSTSAVRSSTDTQGYRVDRWSNALGQSTVGLSDALRRKRSNGSKRLVQLGGLYIWVPPVIWNLLEFRETLDTLKYISKLTKEQIDHILRFSTSLALE